MILFLFTIPLLISLSVTEAIPQELITQKNQVLDNAHLSNIILDLQTTTTFLQERVEHISESYEVIKKERAADKAMLLAHKAMLLEQQQTIKRLKLQLRYQGSGLNVLQTRMSKTEQDNQGRSDHHVTEVVDGNSEQLATTQQQTNTSEYQDWSNETEIPDLVGASDGLQNTKYSVAETRRQVQRSAFYARAHSSVAVSDNEVIKFEDAVLNIGNNFDHVFSVFTCTIPGTYVFTHNLFIYDGKRLQNVIVKNGVLVAWLEARDETTYGSAATSCIINLNAGDRVWVKVDGSTHSSGTLVFPQFTSFSGFLLYPTY